EGEPRADDRREPPEAAADLPALPADDVEPLPANDARPPPADDARRFAEAVAEPAPAEPTEAPLVVAPQAGTVRYLVYYGDPAEGYVVATIEQSFEIGAGSYRLHSEGRAKGLTSLFYRGTLVQESVGTVSAAGLEP